MPIVGGLDLHRKQVTFDVVDTATGVCERGRIAPADRESFRFWLAGFEGQPVDLAVEGCTGWRFVVEECQAAGVHAHLAEPADVAGLKGRRQHAKTDRFDARHLRELLEAGNLPECWIPPQHVLEVRAKVRLYKDLLEERGGWQQRIHATLFHLGAPVQPDLLGPDPDRLVRLAALSPATRQTTVVALRMIDCLDRELITLRAEIVAFGRRQPGCLALQNEYGIGALTSVVIWSEMGDARRFANSRNAVRHTGLDISVYSSDGKRSRGHLTPARAADVALGGCLKLVASPRGGPRPITPTTSRSPAGWASNAPRCRSPANSPDAVTTDYAPSATTPSRRSRNNMPWPSTRPARRSLMPCGPLQERHRRQHHMLDGLERLSVCTPRPAGHPIDHHVAERPDRSCTEISLGARGHGH